MARIEFGGELLSADHARLTALVAEERDGKVPNLFAALIESPAIGEAWLRLGTAVRYRSDLDDRLREVCICLVGLLTDCDYELCHHVPLMQREGVPLEWLGRWRDEDGFSERERAALAYTETIVAAQGAPDDVWADLSRLFTVAEIVTLTATGAYYCAVARFLKALDVDLD